MVAWNNLPSHDSTSISNSNIEDRSIQHHHDVAEIKSFEFAVNNSNIQSSDFVPEYQSKSSSFIRR
jgi:hypothetical protein